MRRHLARDPKDLLPIPRRKRIRLADDLDNLCLELLLRLEELLPQFVPNLPALEQRRQRRFGVPDGPDESHVVHGASEEGGDQDRLGWGRVEREEGDVQVAGLVLGEPGLCGGLVCTRGLSALKKEGGERTY